MSTKEEEKCISVYIKMLLQNMKLKEKNPEYNALRKPLYVLYTQLFYERCKFRHTIIFIYCIVGKYLYLVQPVTCLIPFLI